MNIHARAVCFARSNMGQDRATAQKMKSCADVSNVDAAVQVLCADMIEEDVYDMIVEEAEGWMATLRDLSEKQIRASWPDMMALFEEAGV